MHEPKLKLCNVIIIRRINEANQNVLQYMDDRAQMKLSRLADALNTFDNDAL